MDQKWGRRCVLLPSLSLAMLHSCTQHMLDAVIAMPVWTPALSCAEVMTTGKPAACV